jgi:hypothetical protein
VLTLSMLAIVLAMAPRSSSGQGRASITGVVRDSNQAALADVEVVVLREGAAFRSARTGATGAFTLEGIPVGLYTVWFRRIGFASSNYRWDAAEETSAKLTIELRSLAHTLNPVVVWEEEERRMRFSSSLLGLVVDDQRRPIDEVSVEILGTALGGSTRRNGGFLFKPVPPGSYVVRARKIGFAPASHTLTLVPGEERELILSLAPLATNLPAAQIIEESGFGGGQTMLADLDRRLRWHGARNFVLGSDELRRFGTRGLDEVAKLEGVGFKELVAGRRGGVTSINGNGQAVGKSSVGSAEGDACILLDGKFAVRRPLSSFPANELELVEIYPSRTEVTETIADRMHGACAKSPLGHHPTYYVIWTRGSLKR